MLQTLVECDRPSELYTYRTQVLLRNTIQRPQFGRKEASPSCCRDPGQHTYTQPEVSSIWLIMQILVIFLLTVAFFAAEVHGFQKLSPRKMISIDHGRLKRDIRVASSLLSVIDCKTAELSFEEQIQTKWAIVDFYADWCGPCKIAAKTFQSVAEEYPDKSVKFIKVDTEIFEDSVDDYGLKGLPVFGAVKDGKLL